MYDGGGVFFLLCFVLVLFVCFSAGGSEKINQPAVTIEKLCCCCIPQETGGLSM